MEKFNGKYNLTFHAHLMSPNPVPFIMKNRHEM